MNKQDLIDAIAEETSLPKTTIKQVLESQTTVITDALSCGQEVTVHGIGKLEPVLKAARQGRNPQTGAAVTIEARTNVKFKGAKALKDALN